MLELGIGADIVRGIGLLIWLAFFACLAFALWIGKNRRNKVMGAVLVTLLFIAPAAPGIYRMAVYKHNYAKAKALFDERCKTAGEKVMRRVEGVDGVLLLKIRPPYANASSHDPMYPGAALIDESGGDEYIKTFLKYERPRVAGKRSELTEEPTPLPGYRYVDVVDPTDGKRYRYTASIEKLPFGQKLRLDRVEAPSLQPRYAVTYDDLVASEDRKYWIAATTTKIVDTSDNSIIATSTLYAMEPGQGSPDGGRQPWTFAQRCPRSFGSGATRYFVDQVLQPIQGR